MILEPTQQWVRGAFLSGCEDGHSPPVVPRLRLSGAVPLAPHVPS